MHPAALDMTLSNHPYSAAFVRQLNGVPCPLCVRVHHDSDFFLPLYAGEGHIKENIALEYVI